MNKLLLSCILAIACSMPAYSQEQRMIYAELAMTKADTVEVDLTSTCAAYQRLVLSRKDGRRMRFKSLQKAVNHLARYGWKVSARSEKTVTMEYPYSIAVVYGEQGMRDMENMLKDYRKSKK